MAQSPRSTWTERAQYVAAKTVTPNNSLNLTRYGSQRLAAAGARGIMPSAARRRLPPRAG